MRYGQIRKYDVANGVGIRTSFFVTGCTRNCPDCFNTEYQDFKAGNVWSQKETDTVIEYLKLPEVQGLTILGGEPFENEVELKEIVEQIRNSTEKSIWVYSGFTIEQILQDENKKQLLKLCDVLVDGPFVKEKKNLKLKFRGSENQRIIDVQKTLEDGEIVLYNLD